MSKYIISPPGGPAGLFYSIVDLPMCRVIAMQIPELDDARRIVQGLELLDKQEGGDDDEDSNNRQHLADQTRRQ